MANDETRISVGSHPFSRRTLVGGAAGVGLGAALMGRAGVSAGSRSALSAAGLQRLQSDPKTLVVAMDGSPSDLDPHSAYDYRSVLAILGAYEGLIGLDGASTDQFVGLIAESWESNEDQSVWTFKLRAGVTFQNGDPCDAEAIKENYRRQFTLGLGALGVISRFFEDVEAQVQTPDAQTVVFDLGKPQPLFPFALASTYGAEIVNAKAMRLQEVDGDWGHVWAQTNAEGTGTGPYKIVEFTPGDQLVMEKNESYWGGWEGEHFDRIILRVVLESATRRQLIEQGEADIVDSVTAEDVAALAENPDITLLRDFTTQVNYFPMTVYGPLTTPQARQALCWAMPYQEVIDGVFNGYARQPRGCVAQNIRGYSPTTFQYTTDLEKAKALLAEAGVAEGTTLTLMLETGVEKAETAAQLLQNNLSQIGINLQLELVDLTTFTAAFYGDAPLEERPNLYWWGWWPDYNDAWNHLYPQVSSQAQGSAGANAGFYANARVDELLDVAKDAPDEETYLSSLAELQEIVSKDDPPAIYYVEPQWTTFFRNNVQGVFFNPINIGTYNFYKMSRTAS